MKHGSILVTGGAGYIGSHVALQLRARGERVVILDDLSRGFRQAALDTPLIVGEVGDRERVRGLLKEHGVDTVMHFAAYTIVPESVREPLKYYRNNTGSTGTLLECCLEAQVRHFVFSSTAAVYGTPAEALPRRAPRRPRSIPTAPPSSCRNGCSGTWRAPPPCATRRCATSTWRLGYRRAHRPGHPERDAADQGRLRSRSRQASAPLDLRHRLPHPDGTGVRDYIHVEDLASAHVDALTYLRGGGASITLNAGYGHGYSVRQVLESVERVSGKALAVREEPRRAGDPGALVARADRIRAELLWRPRLDDLDTIVRSALAWEERLLRDPW